MIDKKARDYLLAIPLWTKKKNTLDEVRHFLKELGNPDEQLRIIHVAGTNGKGSVCADLTAMLMEAGYHVGTFVSPHLTDVTERFLVDGVPVEEAGFSESFARVKAVTDRLTAEGYAHPTFFEFVFLMAMDLYGRRKPDFVVLETGLGGRLDTTNVIRHPLACVITSISRDHMQYLGNTLEEIATEKAGILKNAVPAFYIEGQKESNQVIEKRAKELGMTNTTFKNCNGLPIEGHLTTARDISIMSLELLKHPTILKYSGTYMETISEGRKSPIELVNHNKLVRFFDGCDGLKTGFTQEAKYCISATAVRNGVRMLAVIMGAPTYKIRNRDASMLMNYGFSKYQGKKLFNKDDDVETVYLGKSEDRYYVAKAKDDLSIVFLKGSEGEPQNKIILNEPKDSYTEGEIVGKCEVYLDGQKVGEVELYCDRDVEKGGFIDNLKYNMKNLFKKGV